MRPHLQLSQRNSGKPMIVYPEHISAMHEYKDFDEQFTSITLIGGGAFSVRESLAEILAMVPIS